MKKVIFIFLFFSLKAYSSSFIFETTITNNNGNFKIVIGIDFKKWEFKEMIIREINESFENNFVSQGTVKIDNDTILLRDSLFGFVQKFVLNDSIIVAEKCLVLKSGEILKKRQENNSFITLYTFTKPKPIDTNRLKCIRFKNINNGYYVKIVKLIKGDKYYQYFKYYKKYNVLLNYYSDVILLHNDGSYQYKFYDFIVSEGEWHQDGKLICLTDSSLKYNFYGIIRNKQKIEKLHIPPMMLL